MANLPAVKSIKDIRRANLLRLVSSAEGQASLAARLDRDRNQIWQWTLPDDDPRGRGIGHKSARRIEQALDLQSGWMDQDHSGETGELSVAVPEQPTINALMNELGPPLRRAPPHIRNLVGRSLLEYSNNPDDGAAIAKAIRSLLEPYA